MADWSDWLNRAVRTRASLALLVAASVAGASVVYAYAAPKRYDAVSRVVVHPVPAGDDTYAGIDLLRDTQDGARVLGTAESYFETPEVIAAAADRIGSSPGQLGDHVDVRTLAGSNVLEIVGNDRRPRRAAEIANAVRQEGVAQRTARFQAQLASVLSKLARLGSVEARRRVIDLRSLQGRPDPTLETLTAATAPTEAAWPDAGVIVPAGVGIGLGLGALVALLPPLFRRRPAEAGLARDEKHEQELADREQALRRRADAIAQRERELATAVAEARGATADEQRLQQRSAAVTKREQQLARRAAELAQRERALEVHGPELDGREGELRARKDGLDTRERELDARGHELEANVRELEERTAELEQRERQLEEQLAAPAPEPEPVPQSQWPSPQPGGWVIQDLERLLAQHGNEDPDRIEEWRYYVHFLREHADVDGRLPATFDYLVEETFRDILPSA